ncbi:MAG: glutamate racemase [Coriobacteriales bacterium]|nr:glutamate racemase [Coriobacteriaceae bacterium]MDY2722994.1 glutamate racemase [Coriobacteriales bacterium]
MNNKPIGIFDSGFGGLTVARAIHERLPQESLIFFGDTERCPYGTRDLREVRGFVRQICTWLSKKDVKMIVIACNTATAAGLALAQMEFDVPVVGVVEPGARGAVRMTRNRKVGVIATQATVDSAIYADTIRTLDAGVTVYSSAAPRFVEIVEDGLRKSNSPIERLTAEASDVYLRPAFQEIARDYLDPIKKAGVDTLVLGCTHYPVLEPLIQQAVGENVSIISSSDETAKEVVETLTYRGHLCDGSIPPHNSFNTTGRDLDEFRQIGGHIFGEPIEDLSYVDIDTL